VERLVDRVAQVGSGVFGGRRRSVYTMEILKADVTTLIHGVSGGGCRPNQCGTIERDTPDEIGQGMLLSAGMARGLVLVL
jgi:hypothetical protein